MLKKGLVITLSIILGATTVALAQTRGGLTVASTNFTPQFFTCLLAGLILALGFQLLLANLSVAAGITAVGDIEKNNKRKRSDQDEHKKNDVDETPTGVKVSNTIGAWGLVTASLSLFLASLFAVKLSLMEDNRIGATLGLIIWAAFFIVMVYLEMKSITSLLGGIINTAMSGLKNSFSAVSSIVGKSDESKVADAAKKTVEEVTKELSHQMDNSSLFKKLEDYLSTQQKNQEQEYSRFKKEIKDLLTEIEFEKHDEIGQDGIRRSIVKIAESHPHLTKEKVQKVKEVFEEVKSVAQGPGAPTDKLAAAFDKLSPGSEEEAREEREKLINYLRKTEREELKPENLKRDLEEVLKNPARAKDVISARFSQFDRGTIVSLLEQKKGISHEQAEKITSYVQEAWDFVKSKTGKASNGGTPSYGMGDMQNKYAEGGEGIKAKIEEKISNYFNSMDRPELSYDVLKRDFEYILHEPGATFSVLKERFNQMDRESLIALISSRKNTSREDAEKMVTKIEEARDNVLRKAEKIQIEAELRVHKMKKEALHQAENARKTAASAAWWLFAAAVVSALASAAGGMLALT